MTRSFHRLVALALALTPLAGCSSAESYAGGSDTSAVSTAGDPGGEAGGDGGGDGGGDPGGDSSGTQDNLEPGQLTAGEWRDLDHWGFWTDLLAKPELAMFQDIWGFYTEQRFPVVVTSDGVPLADASVILLGPDDAPLWRAHTDVHGEAELFAGILGDEVQGPFSIEVDTSAGQQIVDDVQPGEQAIAVSVAGVQPPKILDLMFVIDTTGSMGDELSYLQTELADVVARVRTKVGDGVQFRLSVNFYRDEGDEYVVRPFPFTTDIDAAIADLAAQAADGGGDLPEAVHSGLADAIDEHQWSESATSRLCFLVLDAPPHEDEATLAAVQKSVRRFAEKGVRLVPLAASGVDQSTEFMLRFYAISTGGTYTFLTDDSGVGAPHLEPTIGEYTVERLNDLMVRLITASLTP